MVIFGLSCFSFDKPTLLDPLGRPILLRIEGFFLTRLFGTAAVATVFPPACLIHEQFQIQADPSWDSVWVGMVVWW